MIPVHVFTSGDEAELFLNGESLGRREMGDHEYRLRWDEVKYEPGELRVVAYRDGEEWAEDLVQTTGKSAALEASADRNNIRADGKDLSFVTIKVQDENGLTVPMADNNIRFSIEGPGEIVATSNGDPTNFTPFPSHERVAFNCLVLAIVRGIPDESGTIILKAESDGLESASVQITTSK